MIILGYVVTARVVDGSKVVGIKVYNLATLDYKFIWRKSFRDFFSKHKVLNIGYNNSSLITKNDFIPIKGLRKYNKWGYILSWGIFSESTILASYLGVDEDLVYVRVCGALVSGAITDLSSREASAHARMYYAEIRMRKDDIGKIANRLSLNFEVVRRIKNYLFLEIHDLGDGRVDQFDADFAIAQSWQRLSDINMSLESHDITLIKHEMLEMEYIEKGYARDIAHSKASGVYNYSKEAKLYYDKVKKRKI